MALSSASACSQVSSASLIQSALASSKKKRSFPSSSWVLAILSGKATLPIDDLSEHAGLDDCVCGPGVDFAVIVLVVGETDMVTDQRAQLELGIEHLLEPTCDDVHVDEVPLLLCRSLEFHIAELHVGELRVAIVVVGATARPVVGPTFGGGDDDVREELLAFCCSSRHVPVSL